MRPLSLRRFYTQPVPPEAAESAPLRRAALWEWPSVLSLDAPLIAVLWQLLLSRALGASLDWRHHALLGAAVWLIYSADRWLDGLKLGVALVRTQRHHFYVRHRRAVLRVWLGLGAATLTAGLAVLTRLELAAAGVLGAALLGYFRGRHARHPKGQLKELQIALVFAPGVSLLPLLRGAAALPTLTFTLLLAALIFLNCALIALWEGELDREPVPLAVRAPRLVPHLPGLALGLALGCGLAIAGFAADGWAAGRGYRPLFSTLGFSALLLYGGGFLTPYLSPAARRVAADAALLTPLLVLPFTRG